MLGENPFKLFHLSTPKLHTVGYCILRRKTSSTTLFVYTEAPLSQSRTVILSDCGTNYVFYASISSNIPVYILNVTIQNTLFCITSNWDFFTSFCSRGKQDACCKALLSAEHRDGTVPLEDIAATQVFIWYDIFLSSNALQMKTTLWHDDKKLPNGEFPRDR